MPSFNDIEMQRIKKIVGGFCQERIPDHQRTQVKLFYEVRGFEVKIIESRPSSPNRHIWIETPISRLQYNPDTYEWQLYWLSGSGKWQKYKGIEPTNSLRAVVDEIAIDPFLLFWG